MKADDDRVGHGLLQMLPSSFPISSFTPFRSIAPTTTQQVLLATAASPSKNRPGSPERKQHEPPQASSLHPFRSMQHQRHHVPQDETQRRNIAADVPRNLDCNKVAKAQHGKPKKQLSTRYPLPEKPRQKRAVIQDMVRPLKQWLLRHRHNPYPTKAEKVDLAVGSSMSLVQVSNWFANARRRLKNVVQDSKCSWSKRLRMYNQFVQGNAELLSICSDDSIWDSDSEGEEGNESGRDIVDVEETSQEEKQRKEEEEEDESQLNMYKKTILQRYLSDSVQQQQQQQQSSSNEKSRKRRPVEDRTPDFVTAKKEKLEESMTRAGNVLHPRPILPLLVPPPPPEQPPPVIYPHLFLPPFFRPPYPTALFHPPLPCSSAMFPWLPPLSTTTAMTTTTAGQDFQQAGSAFRIPTHLANADWIEAHNAAATAIGINNIAAMRKTTDSLLT